MIKIDFVRACIASLEAVISVPCPEGFTREINSTESSAKAQLAALELVSKLHEYVIDNGLPFGLVRSRLHYSLAELLDSHGFGEALEALDEEREEA